MNILKRALVWLTVFALVIPGGAVLAAGTDRSEAYDIFGALGYLPAGRYEQDDANITRAEFAHLVACIRGVSGGEYSSEAGFLDVPAGYWCAVDIYSLKALGIIDGINAYQFLPDDDITYGDAAKILVGLLGRSMKAEMVYGGYPAGYMRAARELDIISASHGSGDFVTVGDALAMCYETAQSSFYEFDGIENGEPVFRTDKSKTVFSEYCGLYKVEGVLTDDGFTALDGKSAVSEQMLVIGGLTLEKGSVSTEGCLGRYVRVFYYDDGTDRELRYIATVEKKNNVVEIDAKDISDRQDGSAYVLYYYNGGREKKVTISDTADIIYNGAADTSLTIDAMRISDGELTLVDNDRDGKYDVVIIFSYESFVVTYTDFTNKKLYGRYGECADYSEAGGVSVFNGEGDEISVNDILAGNTVMYAAPNAGGEFVIYVTDTRVNGTLEQIYRSDNGKLTYYVIGGKEYAYSATYKRAVDAGAAAKSELKVGETYTFYTDYRGRISDVAAGTNTGLQYVYLLDARGYTDEQSGEDRTRLKFFMSTGEINRAVAAEKVSVNSERILGEELINDTRLASNGKTVRQLVQIRFNDVGEIKELNFCKTPNIYGYNSNEFSLDYTSSSAVYKGSSTWSFAGKYCVTTNALIFFVPTGDDFGDEDIEVGSLSRLVSGSKYSIEVYDADASLTSGMIVVRVDDDNAEYDTSLFVVDKVVTGLNEDDERVKQVSGVQYGTYVTGIEKKPGVIDEDVKKGDVARISMRGGEIISYQRITSLQDNPEPFIKYYDGASTLINTLYTVQYGYVYGKSEEGITIVTPEAFIPTYGRLLGYSLNGGNVKVTIYDRDEGTVRVGSLADVTSNSVIDKTGKITTTESSGKIIVYRRYDYAREIVVVR